MSTELHSSWAQEATDARAAVEKNALVLVQEGRHLDACRNLGLVATDQADALHVLHHHANRYGLKSILDAVGVASSARAPLTNSYQTI